MRKRGGRVAMIRRGWEVEGGRRKRWTTLEGEKTSQREKKKKERN
jgi:hypothetical protein